MINYNYIQKVVIDAGKIMRHAVEQKDIFVKGTADFVTYYDLEVQKYIFSKLHQSYPEIGFIGEEKGDYQNNVGTMQWILDPIDGTTNYIYGYNHSAISLALKKEKEIIWGMVYNPFTEEAFMAEKGKGAFLNGCPIKVTSKTALSQSLVAVGTSPYHKEMATKVFKQITDIFEKSLDIRRTGSAALDLAYLASGRQDAYFEYDLKPWDYAAGAIIVKEAGGLVQDIKGGELSYEKNSDLIACCNRSLLHEMKEVIK